MDVSQTSPMSPQIDSDARRVMHLMLLHVVAVAMDGRMYGFSNVTERVGLFEQDSSSWPTSCLTLRTLMRLITGEDTRVMQERIPVGIVMQDGDRYVGRCEEAGTNSVGQTVAEAFANLRVATWQRLAAEQDVAAGALD